MTSQELFKLWSLTKSWNKHTKVTTEQSILTTQVLLKVLAARMVHLRVGLFSQKHPAATAP